MDKVYKLYVSDQISADGFGRTYKPLEERLKALDDQLPRLQAELDFLAIQNLSRDEIISEAQDLYGRWSDLLPEEKRQIVENVVERITIGKEDVAIDLATFLLRLKSRQKGNAATRVHRADQHEAGGEDRRARRARDRHARLLRAAGAALRARGG